MKNRAGIFFAVIMMMGLMVSSPALAAEIREPLGDSGNITIQEGEILKNLYTAGAIVSMNGTIEKGLHVAGGSVLINGSVGQDVHAVGGTVIVRGNIGGTLHIGAGEVIVEGAIGDDLIIGGGNVYIGPSATIGGDLIVGAGNLVLDAPVGGKVLLGAGEATLNSAIAGPVKANAELLTLGESAQIGGDLIYKAYEEVTIIDGAVVNGLTTFDKIVENKVAPKVQPFVFPFRILLKVAVVIALVKILAIIAAGLILVYPLKKLTTPILNEGFKNFWPNLGVGIIGLVMIPVATFILAITMIGLGLAGILGGAYLLAMALAAIFASIIFGSWFIKTITKGKKYQYRWQEVVVGTLLLGAINFLPIIGWITVLIIVSMTLGAMMKLTYTTLTTK
ncbi:MAG: hypothetical protein ABH846_02545 [Patescibacteria group bacterium]